MRLERVSVGTAFVSVWRVAVGDVSALWVSVKLFDGQSVWPLVGEMLFVNDKTASVKVSDSVSTLDSVKELDCPISDWPLVCVHVCVTERVSISV